MISPPDLIRIPFIADLARYGNRPAVLQDDMTVSYGELAEMVSAVERRLGSERRLVALAAANDLSSLVGYLAALLGGHPLVLLPHDKPAAMESLVTAYDPDVILRPGSSGPEIEERRAVTIHELHPDLALLLSTSGSTGSPKLVRLSAANLQSNAEAIAQYLGIEASDRAMTALPMSYCYGLSVINSHLLRGAGLVMTGLSVVDPCFWDLFRHRRATSLAAVPYTFDLLDKVGFTGMDLPSLRYVTQAGGKMDPGRVREYAEVGRAQGWDLFVMYGQTEATARMAYLPPAEAAAHPNAIGIPVPGGSFRLDAVPGLEHCELVYSGPNVMLGYACTPGDLADGRTVHELRTGDLGRLNSAGLYEIVGRRSRFVKIVGLRVDMGQVEHLLSDIGVTSACAGTDAGVVIAIEGDHDTHMLAKVVAQGIGLPRAAVTVRALQRLPRLGTGKVDYAAVLALADPGPESDHSGGRNAAEPAPASDSVRRIFRETLERDDIDDGDTFVTLGGDSLSYIATSVRLEQLLGRLPADWHVTTIRELERDQKTRRRSGWRRVASPIETSIVLRAVAIVFIVSTHVGLMHWPGTAHVLMAVAGFNFARFQLDGERQERFRRQLRSLGRVVLPSMTFIAVAFVLTDKYSVANILLLNSIVGPTEVTTEWHFWFIEVLAYILLGMAVVLVLPWAAAAERRRPWLFPLALTGIGLVFRYELFGPGLLHTSPALWLFALGWAIARSRNVSQRIVVSVLACLTVPGYFDGDFHRELTLGIGILLLAWLPAVPVARGMQKVVVLLASASLYIYLAQWLIFPPLAPVSDVLAVVASLAGGVAYWALWTRAVAPGAHNGVMNIRRWMYGRRQR